ncbi:receptor kinase-like protein Xa21 [Camellia sinensis]|uniref:receptor kinase-like protein Xa21 n=1 Tax=Camellia sinensis TaxID=4442 RepID=UPI0010369625|nr:receptor kinase-like protein Xa21 [Camellia sinensis]
MEGLYLQYNNLMGPIPATIFNISTLQIIAFTQNQFSSKLPSSIGVSLPNLERLHLGENELSGIVPDSISNASKLIILVLSNNRFNGSIPSSLGNLRLLDYLYLSGNNFTCEYSSSFELNFLTFLSSCRQLTKLVISSNPLNGILPASIGNLSDSLGNIDASYCGIRGSIPSEIANLSNLAFLNIDGNELTGFIPITIKNLSKLQILSLYDNRIQGFIPVNLCYLKNLGALYLGKNNFSGLIPACLGNITSLRYLDLDSNKLISSIPTNLWSLKDLLELNLSSNYLSGYLPLELGNLKVAISIDLSMNQLSGQIPSTIGGLQGVINLSVAHNRLQGPIPQSIGSLIDLEFCDLSHNNLSGVIPKSLEELLQLMYFNVSFNRLTGEIPSRGSFANFTYQSFMSNEALCGAPRLQVPPCHTSSPHQSRTKQILLVVYILLPIASMLLAMIFVFASIRRHRRRNKIPIQTNLLLARISHGRITYHELSRATDMFSESNLLGTGSFSSVYKGMLPGRKIFATKVFKLELDGAFKSFETECEILRNIRHRNLTKVISSCSTLDFKALVLEYMPNGTLEKWLYSHNYFLDILQRLDIMIDVACALEYLHHGYSVSVAHCDLKPSNVLLDDDMVAHVSDFGIAKLLGVGESIAQTRTIATFGCIAPGDASILQFLFMSMHSLFLIPLFVLTKI